MNYKCIILNKDEIKVLKKIKRLIYSIIIKPLQSEKNFNEILALYYDLCKIDNIDSLRFIVCLGIDLTNNLLEALWIQEVLKKIDYSDATLFPIQKFDSSLNNNRSNFYKDSKCCDNIYAKEKYSTVLNWGKLFENFKLKASRSKYAPPITNAQSDYYFHKIVLTKQVELDSVDDWASYRTGLTWLLPYNELLGILNTNKTNPDVSNMVLDAIGLEPYNSDPKKGYDHLIYIEFPDRFCLPCFQPTTLCESWRFTDSLYLSFKNFDGHGRTVSTSGGNASVKERVLNSRKYSEKDFIPFNIGRPNKKLIKNNNRIINIAIAPLGFVSVSEDARLRVSTQPNNKISDA